VQRPLRIRLTLAVLLVASGLAAWVFLGGRVGSCLGPLGVTHVQCVKASGIYPTVGEGLPLLSLALLISANVLIPGLLRPLRLVGPVAAAGALLGALAYLGTRPLLLEGLDSRGVFLSVPVPIDPPAALAAAVFGATAAIVGLWLARWTLGRAQGRSPRAGVMREAR
jgi:hypothetical protein